MRPFFSKNTRLHLTLLFLAVLWGCKKDFALVNQDPGGAQFPISVEDAKSWFNANRPQVSSLTEEEERIIVPVEPAWDKASVGHSQSGKEIIMVPLQSD